MWASSHLFAPWPDARLQALHDHLRLVELLTVPEQLDQDPGHVVDGPQGGLLCVVFRQVERFQHFLHAVTFSSRIWSRHNGLEFFSQVVESAKVRGQTDVLPGDLRPQALAQVKLTVSDESDVVATGENWPGKTVKLADDGGEGRGTLHVVLRDSKFCGYFLWQNVLVYVPSRWRHGELVYSNYL